MLLTWENGIGSIGKYGFYLAQELRKQGSSVKIFAYDQWREVSTANNDRVEVVRVINFPVLRVIDYRRKLKRIIGMLEPDVVHACVPSVVCNFERASSIVTFHTTSFFEARMTNKLSQKIYFRTFPKMLEHRAISQSDHLIAVNDHIKKELTEKYDAPSSAISVIHNGVDEKVFSPAQPNTDRARRKLDLPPSCFVIISVLRLEPRKNPELLIKAFNKLVVDNPERDYRLILVGRGVLLHKIWKYIREKNLSKYILLFSKRISEDFLSILYKCSDVFLLLSSYEGMPLTVLEAMSSGLPIILTKFGGSEKLVNDGVNGFQVDFDLENICYAITSLHDENLRFKLGQASRQIVLNHFTWKLTAEKTSEVYLKKGTP